MRQRSAAEERRDAAEVVAYADRLRAFVEFDAIEARAAYFFSMPDAEAAALTWEQRMERDACQMVIRGISATSAGGSGAKRRNVRASPARASGRTGHLPLKS